MSQVVFFETINHGHRPLVAWYLARGYRVSVFDFTRDLRRSMAWLRRLIHEGRVESIYFHPGSRADGLAIDATEWFYPRVSSHPLIRRLGDIAGEEEAAPVFKHALVQSLSRYFYVRLFLERYVETGAPPSGVTLVPEWFCMWDRVLQEWCPERFKPLTGIRMPLSLRLWGAGVRECAKALRSLKVYLGSGIYLALAWVGRALTIGPKTAAPLQYTYAHVIESPFHAKLNGGRRFDFLLDHRMLKRENTAFIVDRPAEGQWIKEARAAGYHILRRSDYLRPWSYLKYPPRKLDLGLVMKALGGGIGHLGAPEWLHQAAASGIWTQIKEAGFLERVRFAHYIYANQYGLRPRWVNVLVRKAGAQSWYFAPATGGIFLYGGNGAFADGGDFGGRDRFWSYENADHFVAPCRQMIDFYQKHRQQIRAYHDVGNIWSESILTEGKTIDRDAVRQDWFGPLARGRKVIAWFDTSFVEAPNSPSTFTEAIMWYSDILRLVDERDDLCMVIKPSKNEAYYIGEGRQWQWSVPRVGRELMRVWAALRNHPRVRFLEQSTDPSTVVAASDLTVTFCFSSVSAEALGAGKRAIWYEPGERWRETFFGGEPMLVAHGFAELRSLVQKLLYEMSDEEYQAYLQNKVRELVDSFLDGSGLSRFRALLAGEAAPTADA